MNLKTVLVVEDEPIVALNLQRRLRKLGYEVPHIANTGDEALKLIDKITPDIVLMDINIDGSMDGIETASRIPSKYNVPVVYLTAYSEDATLERARATKPYGYLIKPFSERELHAVLQMVLERSKADVALLESEKRLQLALEAAAMGSWDLDLKSRKMLRIGSADALFGFPSEILSVTWDTLLERVYGPDRIAVAAALDQAIINESSCDITFRSLRSNHQLRWLKIQGKVICASSIRGASRIIGVVQDVTERKSAELKLQQAAAVFASSSDGILVLNGALRVLVANQSYFDITGESMEQVIGRLATELDCKLIPEQQSGEILDAARNGDGWSGEVRGVRQNGERLPMLVNFTKINERNDDFTGFVIVLSDLTEVRNAEQQLYHLAHHDSLTGLPNRLLARDRMENAIEHARRRKCRMAALFLDLDDFKRVNDTLGHDVGDELLCTVAARLQKCVRQEDTVARLGGDEFMIMLDRIERIEEIVIVAEKILTALGEPISLTAHEINIAASVGISLFPDDADNRDDLIRAADMAMYSAKHKGRNRYMFYTEKMTASAVRYMELDQDLRRGLKHGELELFYQPQIALASGLVVGVEALIRWRHPTKGLVGAADIIPIAEESGLIVDIGEWVLQRACEQARDWREAGWPALRIAVNVSARQMQQDRFVNALRRIIQETELPAGQLEIELTESTLQDEESCVATLHELKKMGITLAIDDFGTGYSCLSSLKNLPIHRIKIDRAFVRDIPDDQNDVAITEAIIAMAHRLSLVAIAEGVETIEQEALLRSRGCDEVQGYLYAKPLAEPDLLQFLSARNLTDGAR